MGQWAPAFVFSCLCVKSQALALEACQDLDCGGPGLAGQHLPSASPLNSTPCVLVSPVTQHADASLKQAAS